MAKYRGTVLRSARFVLRTFPVERDQRLVTIGGRLDGTVLARAVATSHGETFVVVSAGVFLPAVLASIMRRRAYLDAIGGLSIGVGLAGCIGGTSASTSAQSPTVTPDSSGDHPVTPTGSVFSVVDRACGDGRNEATVTFDADVVSVVGVIGGRDTCDTARLAAVDLRDDVLAVTVEVVEQRPTATVACGQCLTDIAYAFETTIPDDGPASARIVHRTADGETTVVRADRT